MAATLAPEEKKPQSPEQPDSPQYLAYPKALRVKEHDLLSRRHGNGDPTPYVGFALSGGGIRSATFCLGVFQALAKKPGLLRKIDYISSVSGGSFFASFYGRLFAREDVVNTVAPLDRLTDVEKLLSPDAKTRLEFPDETTIAGKKVRSWKAGVFRWLRENGRYLAPNGSGDLLIALAVFIRNWATIQLFLASSLLALFLLTGVIRGVLPHVALADTASFWWSPYIYVAGWVALFGVLPLAWGYWCFTLRDPDVVAAGTEYTWSDRWEAAGNFGLRGMIVLAGLGVFLFASIRVIHSLTHVRHLRYAGFAILDLTFIGWQYGRLCGSLPDPLRIRSRRGQSPPIPADSVRWQRTATWIALVPQHEAGQSAGLQKAIKRIFAMVAGASIIVAAFAAFWRCSSPLSLSVSMLVSAVGLAVLAIMFWRVTTPDTREALLDQSEKARNILTQYLRTAIVLILATLLFVLIDSAGQTLYAMSFQKSVVRMLIAAFVAISSVVPFAQRIVSLIGAKKKAGPKISIRVLAGIGAVIVFLPFLLSINVFSHAIAYNFRPPIDAQALSSPQASEPLALVIGGQPSTLNLNVAMTKDQPLRSNDDKNSAPGVRRCKRVLGFLVLTVLFCFLVGGGWTGSPWVFINRSSLHPLYAARLIRAYLGASNNLRYGSTAPGISDPVDGDDIAQEDYWRPAQKEGFWEKGAPLHLVNVTINETVDGSSHTEVRDRKGVGMAIGPAGFSVGIKHHVVLEPGRTKPTDCKIFPAAGSGEFRVFAPNNGQSPDSFSGQSLSLGNWTAISGAAVATGLGSLNSLGASLLTGFFNLRLGFWWDSGTDSIAAGTSFSRTIGKWITKIFPAQSSLIDEFMGRFHGTVRQYWYLSDGGHFENLGGYELIRRRLPLIVIIDAEADPDYAFSELANLILKARLDFNAEITFLDRENPDDLTAFNKATDKISECFHYVGQEFIGTLDQLRRGKWASEPVPERKAFFKSVRESGLSLRHVALARVRYLDDLEKVSTLLLIKPTLIGEEPQDVLNYHSANPSFPQQTTAEQFFNEAQWESYRRLGQHIAEKVFNLT